MRAAGCFLFIDQICIRNFAQCHPLRIVDRRTVCLALTRIAVHLARACDPGLPGAGSIRPDGNLASVMRLPRTAYVSAILLGVTGGCSQQSLLPQPGGNAPPLETGSAVGPAPDLGVVVASYVVSGEPTEVYSEVARGALACWMGADGPLKRSHIFQAEAAPPARGGAAEITLHERDATLPDQRGVRAFRVSLAQTAGGTRVAVSAPKLPPDFTQAMAGDVQTWANHGQGCQLRTVAPPPAPVPAPKVAKGKTAR